MLKLLLIGQEIQDNKGDVSCQSSCESQLIQVSVVFIFKFEFYFSYFLIFQDLLSF